MLRSFDYAGGSVEMSGPGRSARAWVSACQSAFLEGYASVTYLHPEQAYPLLRGLELDKALYEVSYEVRNRPGWVGIPIAAVERLVRPRGQHWDEPPIPRGAVGAQKGVL
jgi:predicted trehalose synthase